MRVGMRALAGAIIVILVVMVLALHVDDVLKDFDVDVVLRLRQQRYENLRALLHADVLENLVKPPFLRLPEQLALHNILVLDGSN